MFQAYVITCAATGKRYIGITSGPVSRRWTEHQSNARRRPNASALYAALLKHGAEAFTIEPIAAARSWSDLCAIETTLIKQWKTLTPHGYNLTAGGEGRFGYRPSPKSIEQSAAKHRGKPCHPNTRRRSSAFHRGRKKSSETKAKIGAAKRGKPRSAETKAKLAAYWKARRIAGEFKTSQSYDHSRKAASAQIAKIPVELAAHIARVYKEAGNADHCQAC